MVILSFLRVLSSPARAGKVLCLFISIIISCLFVWDHINNSLRMERPAIFLIIFALLGFSRPTVPGKNNEGTLGVPGFVNLT